MLKTALEREYSGFMNTKCNVSRVKFPLSLAYTPGLLQFKNISRDKYTELSTLDDKSTVLRVPL